MKWIDSRILLVCSIFIMGCECCCECGDPTERFLTLNLNFDEDPGRTCPIPIPNSPADFCTTTGNNAVSTSSLDWDDNKYTLYAEYITCCKDFGFMEAIQACTEAGTCIGESIGGGNNDSWMFTFALNTETSNCSPTIPIPFSKEGTIALTVVYKEPCIEGCYDPSLCANSPGYTVTHDVSTELVVMDADFPINLILTRDSRNCTECF